MEEDDVDEESRTTVSSEDAFADDYSLPSSVTGSEMGQKKLKWKKLLHTVSKLRQENAVLKDGVETARVNDVTILEDRYRGAQADLSTVRKRNNDLKDRVQKLEGDLFETLAENRKMKGPPSSSSGLSSKLENYERNDAVKQVNQLRISYETRIREYDEKLAIMQGTIDHLDSTNAAKKESVTKIGRSGGVIDDELVKSLSKELPRADRKKLESHFTLVLEEKQKTDRRTIDGLVKEVDRVTELLEAQSEEREKEKDKEETAAANPKTTTEQSDKEGKSKTVVESPSNGRMQNYYNFRHIFYSILFGALLSVAVMFLKQVKEDGSLTLLHPAVKEMIGKLANSMGVGYGGGVEPMFPQEEIEVGGEGIQESA